MFHEEEILSATDQLKATPTYPTPYMLAQFASIAYRDCKHGDLKPPEGWLLLTAVNNCRNGYFETAYWHAKHQQVMIAYRGTETNKSVAFLKDLIQTQKVLYKTSGLTK